MRAKIVGALFVLAAAVLAVAFASRQGDAQQTAGALQAPPVGAPCTVYLRPYWFGQSSMVSDTGGLQSTNFQLAGLFRGMDAEWVVLGHEREEGQEDPPPDHWIPREAVLFIRVPAPEQ